MIHEYLKKISDLLIFAVSVKEGDKISLTVDYDCRDAAVLVTEAAYKAGASCVDLSYADNFLHAAAIKNRNTGFVFPGYLKSRYDEVSGWGWKHINIASQAEADIYRDLPPDRAAEYFRQLSAIKSSRMNAIMSGSIPWTLTYLPSEAMASKAFPDLDGKSAVDEYWKQIAAIMHLDDEDPVSYWKAQMERNAERSRLLSSMDISSVCFKGPGTDLSVGLCKAARWMGGFKTSPGGDKFISNIPTAEIFTSPDWRTAEGRVSLTRPFVMHQNLGDIPRGAWFEFRNGRVTDYGAESGKESLDSLFKRDERARYLGELALVDPKSPFAKAGITFFNGLYDENAACHLALGKAYPSTLRKAGSCSDEELLEMGLNTADVHEDMMVGGDLVDVTARMEDGTLMELIKNGEFLI